MNRFVRSGCFVLCTLISVAACQPEFNPKLYPNPDKLFAVGMDQLNHHHWDNASKAFDELTRDLPIRDPLLPLSYFYLGEAQSKNGDHLLAASSYGRISDAFPEDTLAPIALYRSGFEYSKMWRKPELDAQYGYSAEKTLSSLLDLYPKSPDADNAKALLAKLDNMFAEKDFSIGYSYYRRRAYDSGIIYFKDVVRLHPQSPTARNAYKYLLQSYRKIHYTDDARDVCGQMLKAYPNDQEIIKECGSVSSAEASTHHT